MLQGATWVIKEGNFGKKGLKDLLRKSCCWGGLGVVFRSLEREIGWFPYQSMQNVRTIQPPLEDNRIALNKHTVKNRA